MKEIKTETFAVRDAVAACTCAQRGGDTDQVGGGEGRGLRTRPARTWRPGTENNHVQEALGQITDNKVQKERRNPAVTSEEPGAKQGVGSKSRVLCVNPTHSTTKGVGGPTSGHIPTLTPRKEPAHPLQGESKGNHDMFSLPLAVAGAPVKPCLNFLSGL